MATVAGDTDQSSGALKYYASGSAVAKAVTESATATRRIMTLDTDLNSGAGWTGNSGYNGSGGQASKHPTIAIMWILRFI